MQFVCVLLLLRSHGEECIDCRLQFWWILIDDLIDHGSQKLLYFLDFFSLENFQLARRRAGSTRRSRRP